MEGGSETGRQGGREGGAWAKPGNWLVRDKPAFVCSQIPLRVSSFFHRNAKGCTPFMQAICSQAYSAAATLMDAAKRLATTGENQLSRTVLMRMIYPPNSSLGNSPLHVTCCNDTCSFTWTGAEHINQVRSWGEGCGGDGGEGRGGDGGEGQWWCVLLRVWLRYTDNFFNDFDNI